MKIYIYTLLLLTILGCKKETPQPELCLFVSFEKDGTHYSYSGNELHIIESTAFSSNFSEEPSSSYSIFLLDSWSFFSIPEPEYHTASLYVNIMQFDTTTTLSESGLEKVFSKGIKDLKPISFISHPLDSIYHFFFIKYISDYPTHTVYRHNDCDDSDQNYFEITEVEKDCTGDKVSRIVIDAKFDLSLCSPDGEKVRLENGKLRYYYKIF